MGPVGAVVILLGIILGRNCRTDVFVIASSFSRVILNIVIGVMLDQMMADMDVFS